MQIKSPKKISSPSKKARKFNKNTFKKLPFWITIPALVLLIVIAEGVLIKFTPVNIIVNGYGISYYIRQMREGLFKDVIINEAKKYIYNEVMIYDDNGLDTIYLDIPFKSLNKMEAKRDEALETGILLSSDDDYVNATIHLEQESPIKIDMRLKGDWTDHLKGDKWSYRIHIDQEDGNIYGMRRFSLQAPETRNFHYEWALHEAFQKEGILTTRYHFVNIVINGENCGIYAIEESFSTELIESQNRREGVLLRFDEDFVWENESNNRSNGVGGGLGSHLSLFITSSETADVTLFREGRILDNEVLGQQAEKAVSLLKNYQAGLMEAEDVFDFELWGRYLALVDLFGGHHGVIWHNFRFYYNPVSGLLEPVGFDHDAGRVNNDSSLNRYSLFSEPAVREIYARELERITTGGYLAELEADLGAGNLQYTSALQKEYGSVLFKEESIWEYLANQAGYFRASLNPIRPMYGHYKVVEPEPGEKKLEISLSNVLILPLELKEISINGEALALSQIEPLKDEEDKRGDYLMLSFYQGSGVIQPDEFIIPIDGIVMEEFSELDVKVIVNVAGLSKGEDYIISLLPQWNSLDVSNLQGLPSQNLEEVLSQHPFLLKDEEQKTVYTKSGIWNVSGDIVVPSGYTLEISANTTLLFEPETILYSYGTPIHFRGTQEFPVILDAQEESWGGIVVLNADESSKWNWAMVTNTASINRNAWMFTGGITFYKSPVTLSHVSISTALAEDAINVIDTNFSFQNTRIWGTPSDGFDSDFSVGNLTNCEFTDIGGDAVDFSGSSVDIQDLIIVNAQDKGISAGEQSRLTVERFLIQGINIGVASKDLSTVSLVEGKIVNASISSVAAYIKKPQYGPGSLTLEDVVIENSGSPICQTNSSILIDNQPVECGELSQAQMEVLELVNE